MDDICKRKVKEIQKHQQYVREWFLKGNRKMLLFHGIGSGKTASSIYAAEGLLQKNISHVYVITPASLRNNFIQELDNSLLNVHNKSKYSVYSYQKFLNADVNLRNSLVIIDEVQNIVSLKGSLYKRFFNILVTKSFSKLHVILLSGTPIFDQPHEIALTLNLLDLRKPLPVVDFYKSFVANNQVVNKYSFQEAIYPYVSSFKSVNPQAFAKRIDTVLLCKMSEHQQNGYNLATKGLQLRTNIPPSKQAFLLAPRIASNVVYPNGGYGISSKLNTSNKELIQQFELPHLEKYSSKFAECIKKLQKSKKNAFVYSNFVSTSGISDFAIALKANGFSSKDFGVFQTGQDDNNKKIVQKFNEGKLKIILGSPAMKEGISLKNCRTVHILDPYWNTSRTEQIIGRAIRFCSHSELPHHKQSVHVYHYIGTIPYKRSVDKHVMHLANSKHKLVKQFEKLIFEASTDCHLFHKTTGVNPFDCTMLSPSQLERINLYDVNTSFDIDIQNVNNNTLKVTSAAYHKEQRLLQLLNAQGIKLDAKKHTIGLKIFVKCPEIVKNMYFAFSNKSLNNLIHKVKYEYSENTEAYIRIVAKKPQKKNSSVKVLRVKCKKSRNPNTEGKCPDKYPFIIDNCCYTRPSKSSVGIETSKNKVYVNGKYTKTMTMQELTNAALRFRATLFPKMKKHNIINSIRKVA